MIRRMVASVVAVRPGSRHTALGVTIRHISIKGSELSPKTRMVFDLGVGVAGKGWAFGRDGVVDTMGKRTSLLS